MGERRQEKGKGNRGGGGMTQATEPSLGDVEEEIFEEIIEQLEAGPEEEMDLGFKWIKLGKGEMSPKFVEFVRNVLATGRKFEVNRRKLKLSNHDNLIFRKDGGIRLEQIIRWAYSAYPKNMQPKWAKPKSVLSAYGCDYLKEIFGNYPPAESRISFWVPEDGACLIRYRTEEGEVSVVLDQRGDW